MATKLGRLRRLGKLRDPEIRAKNLAALSVAAREAWWEVARPSLPEPIFVVGCSRSGTTVTYETLALAPGLRSLGYEVPQLWHRIWGPWHNGWHSEGASAQDARPAHARAARRFYYARLGAGRVLDKTCINVLRIGYLQQLFPDAHFVYVHRDGRDNVSSLMDGWRKDGHFRLTQFLGPFPEEVAIDGGQFREWHFFLPPGWRDYNRARLVEVCAYQWVSANRLALEAARLVAPERWHVVRYEDILEAPVDVFERIYSRLDLEFTPRVRRRCTELGHHLTSIVSGPPKRGKWRERNRKAVESVLNRIAPVQDRLGYV